MGRRLSAFIDWIAGVNNSRRPPRAAAAAPPRPGGEQQHSGTAEYEVGLLFLRDDGTLAEPPVRAGYSRAQLTDPTAESTVVFGPADAPWGLPDGFIVVHVATGTIMGTGSFDGHRTHVKAGDEVDLTSSWLGRRS